MYCPRLDHFARLNSNGTIGKCGHMTIQHGFKNVEQMQNSKWLARVREDFLNQTWPKECIRCRDTEAVTQRSIRLSSIERDRLLSKFDSNYLIVGGVLDNICNSACQSCSSDLSTKIGALDGSRIKVNNEHLLDALPWENIIELDINGGEPTASPRYQTLLENPPPNVKIIRINTNCSRPMRAIEKLLQRRIKVIVTASLDGIGAIHDYVRWPIKWNNYIKVINIYKQLRDQYSNLELQAWTTVSSLNAMDLPNIIKYCNTNNINHDWSFLTFPSALDARYYNRLTANVSLDTVARVWFEYIPVQYL